MKAIDFLDGADDLGSSQSAESFLDAAEPKKQNKGILGDIGTGLKRGVEQMPGMVTGIADIAAAPVSAITGINRPLSRAADYVGEKTGFQPSKWAEQAAQEYSPEMQQSLKAVEQAGGFTGTLKAIGENPRSAVNLIAESLPSTLAGGILARGAMGAVVGAEKLAAMKAAGDTVGLMKAGAIAGGIGEGAVTAGQQMSQTDYNVDPLRAAGAATAAGIGTGIIGGISGRVANKLGLADIEGSIAAGTMGAGKKAGAGAYAGRIAGGAVQEGALEETPQSAQEQVWQNVANSKPWDEGVGKASAQGLVAGMAMGAGVNALPGSKYAESKRTPPAEDKPEIAGLLPAPNYTGTPSDQLLQAEAERQNSVDAAQKNADRLYAERAAYEEAMDKLYLNGRPTITTDTAPLQQNIDTLLAVDERDLKGLRKVQHKRQLDAAFGEVVGITHDADGREKPLTMGALLDSQAMAEDAAKRQTATENANTRAQSLADEESTQQPDIAPGYVPPVIPVVGPLSAIANAAVQSGAHQSAVMQQAAAEQAKVNPAGQLSTIAKQSEQTNGPIATQAAAKVATPGNQAPGGELPGGGVIQSPTPTGDQGRIGGGAEVAAQGLRPAVSAGVAGEQAPNAVTTAPNLVTQPPNVATPAGAFDVSGKNLLQLKHLAAKGQPGWKEAATAELARINGATTEQSSAVANEQRAGAGLPASTAGGSRPAPVADQVPVKNAAPSVATVSAETVAPSQEPIKNEDDWLGALFGAAPTAAESASKEVQTNRQAQDKADRVDSAIAMLTGEIEASNAAAAEVAARNYKSNRKQIELKGDGPGKNGSLSISAINESRKRRTVEALQNASSSIKQAIEFIAENPDAAFKQVADMEAAVTKQFNEGFFGPSAKLDGQLDMAVGSLIGSGSYSGEGSAGRKLRMAAHAYASADAVSQPKTDAAPEAKQDNAPVSTLQPDPALQNRDRGRAASVNQMQSIARNPDYMRLGPSRTPDSGAPMVFAVGNDTQKISPANFGANDTAVMSDGQRVPFRYAVVDASSVEPSNFADGATNPAFASVAPGTIKALNNGRTAGVRAAHEGSKAANYTAELLADQAHGVSPEAIRNTPNPMLVRVYAEQSNTGDMAAKSQGQGLGMSASERATQDAELMTADVLDKFAPGDIASAGNRDFVRSFVGKLAANDVADLMDATGNLSQDGRRRIEAALLTAAYGKSDLVQELFESTDTDIKAIGNALKVLSGQWAAMRQAAKEGSIDPATDMTANLIEAVNIVRRSRAEGSSIAELAGQGDLMGGNYLNELSELFLRIFYKGKNYDRARGGDKVIAALQEVVTSAMNTKAEAGLFGDSFKATPKQIVESARSKIDEENKPASQSSLFGANGQATAVSQGNRSEGAAQSGEVGQRPVGTGRSEGAGKQAEPVAKAAEQAPIAFVHEGDFWNYYGDRAKEIAQAIGVTFMKRNGKPMLGFPDGAKDLMRADMKAAGFDATFEGELADAKKQEEAKPVALLSIAGREKFDPISLDTAAGVVARMRQTIKEVWKVDLRLVPTFSALPQEVKDAIAKYGEDTRAKGVLHKGSVYIVADEHASDADVETTILHEIKGHVGLRRLYSDAINKDLGALYMSIGGRRGLADLAKARGFTDELQGYAESLSNSDFTDEERTRIVMEELLSHIAQDPKFGDKVKAIVGKIRAWLRDNGFMALAKFGEADLLNILAKASKALETVRDDNGPVVLMTAWHGSPHDHNKFDSSKIGTGEGAAAYGHGLYFAGARSVAEWYKSNLTRGKIGYDGVPFNVKDSRHLAGMEIATSSGDRNEAIESIENHLKSFALPAWQEEAYKQALEHIRNGTEAKKTGKAEGKLYQVDLAPSENEYLDWDKPLSEQGEKVRAILEYRFPGAFDDDRQATGGALYKEQAKKMAQFSGMKNPDQFMSDYLHQHGIRGIRYLDGSSRSKPLKEIKAEFLAELPEDADFDEVMDLVGTGQFSPKNEALIKALAADDWLGFDYPAQAISTALGNGLSNYDASPELLKAVSSTKDGGTHNFVIFSDADVSITAKYNKAGKDKLTAADKAIYGMAAEGKSAAEVLKFIASASRNPFNRQVARLLLKTGIAPSVTVGDSKTWNIRDAKSGEAFAAAYDPKTNTVALFRPASAERNALHELIHAASLKALAKNGLASAQMKALFAHVEKTGKLNGMYGIRNVDEFIAEAFSNPKFQAALKQVSAAPVGGKPSSAWDWFIRVVRGILGLKQGADNALSQALDIGVGVMRENMALQSGDGVIRFNHALRSNPEGNRPLNAIRLAKLRRIAAGLERPKDAVFLRVTEDGKAITTGPKGVRIPETFIRFAESNGLDFEARRNGEGRKSDGHTVGYHITSKTEPMPEEYRESGALYFGEGNEFFDRTGKTRYNAAPGKIKQTDTEAFRKWFGDSAVVDSDGKPLVVYHGSGNLPESFSADQRPERYGMDKGSVAFFTENPRAASAYANNRAAYRTTNADGKRGVLYDGAAVSPVYLSFQNPLVVDAQGANFTAVPFEGIKRNRPSVEDIAKIARERGHDGLIVHNVKDNAPGVNTTATTYVAFEPTQIKSAIGNNGDFDGTNPDIRYNVADEGWSVSEPSKLDDVIYAMQDKQVDMKRVMQSIMKTGKQIKDNLNPYLQEELFHGRASKGVKDFLDFELRPLLKEMQQGNIDMGDFEEYLWNAHAQERNAQIAKVNPEMKDGGSGIKTADAKAYLAALSPELRGKYQALAARVNAINKASQKALVDSGLEKQETIDAWNGAYQHYVPLQREDVDSGHIGTGKGFSIRGSSTKRALGSGRKVVDIIANLTMQRERNIVRAEKNRVTLAVRGLAMDNPNADFWTVDEAPKERVIENKAIYTVMDSEGRANEFTRMADAEMFARSVPGANIEQAWKDRVTERVVPGFSSRDNVLLARVNGEDKYVIFNERDTRAMRMVLSLKNLDMDNMGRVLSLVGKATRYLSAINTQYNPVFGVINLIRDTQGALVNLSSTPLAGEQKRVFGYTKDALIGIYKDIRAHRSGKVPSSNWAALFEEFQKEGGQTGYRDQYANAEARAESIISELSQIKEGKPKQMLRGVFGWLSDYNDTMENAVRLAAYKVAKEKGMSKQQAASLAKNLTVNFNRKGQVATQVGALYAFFNASMQGSARLAQTLFEANDGDIKSVRLSKTGKKILVGGIMLGSMQALLLAAAGFDDDEPPDFIRERNLILPIGDGKYLTLAMPLGLHVIPGIGRIATEFVLGGGKDPLKHMAAFAGMFAESFNPIGSAGFSLQTIAPSVIDPFAALAENRDFTGKEIYRENRNPMSPTPGHARAKDVATFYSRWISEGLNFITGGTEFKPGMLSWSPDSIDYLVAQVGGGVMREANKVFQTGGASITGEDLPLYKIPLVGRFVGDTAGQSGESAKFYDAIKQINMHENQMKGLREERRFDEAREYAQENPAVRLIMAGNHAERSIQKLRSLKRDLIKNDADQSRVKEIDERITASMKSFNERAATVF